jgi:diacylglycerol kinase family enzyme
MRIGVLANARAGKGRAGALVSGVETHLRSRGHQVETHWVGQGEPWAERLPDRILIAGGDGTIHRSLPMLIRERTPFLPLPAGTENLLARQWCVGTDAAAIAHRAEQGAPVDLDTGLCNGRPFVLMASVGPDASVIHRVQAKRRDRITHLTYAGPIWREALAPAIATLRWRADGGVWSPYRIGSLVVANSPMYAFRANPCVRADMADGLLDALFMPSRSTAGVLGWALRAACRRAWNHPRASSLRAAALEVEHNAGRLFIQLDGEPAEPCSRLRIDCRAGSVRLIGAP